MALEGGGEAGVSGVFVRVLAWAVEKKISGVLDGLLKADHNLASLLLTNLTRRRSEF